MRAIQALQYATRALSLPGARAHTCRLLHLCGDCAARVRGLKAARPGLWNQSLVRRSTRRVFRVALPDVRESCSRWVLRLHYRDLMLQQRFHVTCCLQAQPRATASSPCRARSLPRPTCAEARAGPRRWGRHLRAQTRFGQDTQPIGICTEPDSCQHPQPTSDVTALRHSSRMSRH